MSTDLIVVPYSRELAETFFYDGIEKEYSGTNVLPILEYYDKQGECFFGILDGEILGVGGIYCLWPETSGCFLFLNQDKARPHKKSVFKILIQYMNTLIERYEVKNLIVECMSESEEANRLIEHLGFIKGKPVMMATYTKEIK